MPRRGGRGGAPREAEASPLPGVLRFRPRLPAILLLLTVTVAVAAYRITREGSGKAVERIAREALAAYGEWPAGGGGAPPPPPADPARFLSGAVGLPVELPAAGGEGGPAWVEARRRAVGGDAGAELRFTASGGRYLLLVVRAKGDGQGAPPDRFFSGSPYLSGERGGLSFVFWRGGGLYWCLVSDRDLTETFSLARTRFPAPGSPGAGRP